MRYFHLVKSVMVFAHRLVIVVRVDRVSNVSPSAAAAAYNQAGDCAAGKD